MTTEAKMKGFDKGRFSFNVKGGRCEACNGDGTIKVDMMFLPDVYVPCEVCHGQRYNRETLEVKYKGKNISEVLNRLVDQNNTVVVIEHNLDVIKVADYIIDLGPEGGDGGGELVKTGTPEEIAKTKKSYTGQFLKKIL